MRASFVRVNELRTRYYHAGNRGPNLVLVHGVGAAADTWVRNIDALAEHCSVYALDLIGHGFSDAIDMADAVPQEVQLRHLFGFIDQLGLDRYTLAGSSFGGMISALAALQRPNQLEKLVLIGAPVFDTPTELEQAARDAQANQSGALAAPLATMIRQRNVGSNFLKDDFFDEIILSQLTAFALPGRLQAFVDTIKGVVRTASEPEWHVHHRLEKIKCPTLVVIGRQDPRAKWERALEGQPRMPDCRVEIFEDCGHKPQSEYANEFNRLLAKFITK
jgi:2-hydroxy-6-oxonona-2,4-dienedioate hydrolase